MSGSSKPAESIRLEQLRIQSLGAAISRRDWGAVEQAYNAIRDAFDRREIMPKAQERIDP